MPIDPSDPDNIVAWLKRHGEEVNRENYIAANWSGDAMPDEWTAEHEGELPEELQDWSLFKRDGLAVVYIGPDIKT